VRLSTRLSLALGIGATLVAAAAVFATPSQADPTAGDPVRLAWHDGEASVAFAEQSATGAIEGDTVVVSAPDGSGLLVGDAIVLDSGEPLPAPPAGEQLVLADPSGLVEERNTSGTNSTSTTKPDSETCSGGPTVGRPCVMIVVWFAPTTGTYDVVAIRSAD
jgi:hypothetical protein